MAGSSTHTEGGHEVPQWADKDPKELAHRIYSEVPHPPGGRQLSARHYLELSLVIASILDGQEGHEIKSGRIYDRLSVGCRTAIKGLDGALTRGVPTGRIDDWALLKKDKNNEQYLDDQGETQFASQGATKWAVNHLVADLYRYATSWGRGPAIVSEATVQAASGNEQLLDHLARPKTSAWAAGLGPEGEAGGKAGEDPDGGSDGGGATWAPTLSGDTKGTTGLDNTPTSDPENPGSERSDGKNGLDICFVNPPVTGRCNRDQWAWLTTRTASIQEQLVFLKLVNSSRTATYNSGEEEDGRWVVMDHEKLRDEYGASSPTEALWRDSALIEAKKDGRFISPQEAKERGVQPKARELRVKKEALERWTELGAEGGSYRYKAHRRRELVRTSQAQPMTTDLYDENRNDIPELVEDALKVLREADHKIMLDAIEEAEEAIAEKEGAEARDQLTSLRLAKETVKRQVIQSQDGVAKLQNAYTIQSISGRVSFKRGGPQGLLGEVKAKAYDLENYRNYDLKSCHTTALKEVASMLEELGVEIDVSPWTEYVGKDKVVARTGLPRSLVKVAEHAVKYGAALPCSMEQVKEFYVDDDEDPEDRSTWPAIAREVMKAKEKGLLDDVDEALSKLHSVFSAMRRVVIEMAEALLNEYYEANHSGGWMKNACGVSFAKHRCDEGHEQRTTVMAWMLQGLEASFCHHLTILSADSEAFSVVANEHDGLIIRKDADDEEVFEDALQSAIETARDRSGFTRAELVEKAHADEEDVEALYGEQEEESEEEPQETAEQPSTDGLTDAPSGDSIPREPAVPGGEEPEYEEGENLSAGGLPRSCDRPIEELPKGPDGESEEQQTLAEALEDAPTVTGGMPDLV